MANELLKKVTQKSIEITGKQWCQTCQMTRTKEGGTWKLIDQGRRRQWKCAQCTENMRQRQAAKIASA